MPLAFPKRTFVAGQELPDVAFAMVQLGLRLENVATALDLEEGMAYLSRKFQTVS